MAERLKLSEREVAGFDFNADAAGQLTGAGNEAVSSLLHLHCPLVPYLPGALLRHNRFLRIRGCRQTRGRVRSGASNLIVQRDDYATLALTYFRLCVKGTSPWQFG